MGIEPNRGNWGLGIKPRMRNHEVLKSPDNLFFFYSFNKNQNYI